MAKKETTKKARDPNVKYAGDMSPVDFVKGFIACKTNAEAEEKLGKGAVARAARMRAKGVKLPKLAGSRSKLDVKALNDLIK